MKRFRAWTLGAGVIVAVAFVAGGATRGESAGESAAVKERQKLMKGVGDINKKLRASVKKGDLRAVADLAAKLEKAARKIPSKFQKKDLSGKTRALAAIWKDKKKFDRLAMDLVKASKAMSKAAKGMNVKDVKKLASGLGKNCGACHKAYRAKKKS